MEGKNNGMTEAVLIVNFSYSLTQDQLKAAAQDFAENVKPNVDGLIWKIFLNQPEKKRSGGVYLFRDAESAQNYLNSSYVEKLKQAPGLSDFSVEIFETMTEASVAAGASMSMSAA
ncbi:MAG TPA: YdhR family protein [Pyrinomonadaceae bacterium]|nr:YdhR family protein [Pyrinomonadaceae bacterium]